MVSDGYHNTSRGLGAVEWTMQDKKLFTEKVMMGGVLQRSFSVLFGKGFKVLWRRSIPF